MRTLHRPAAAFAVAVLAAAGLGLEGKKADPWEVPSPDYAEYTIRITLSQRSYQILLGSKVPPEANPPARVEPPATDAERGALKYLGDRIETTPPAIFDGALRKYLAENPALHDASTMLGISLLRQKKPAEAAAALRDSLIGNRRNPEAWKALEEAAAALGKKVVRPSLPSRGWVLPLKDGTVQVGFADADKDGDFGWNYYAFARAVFRYEGPYGKEFPGQEYRFTFREQLLAAAAAARWAEDERKEGKKVAEDLARLVTEKKGKSLVPFVFFAMYPEPLPAEPEKDFALLRPRLEKYFDEKILVKK